MTPEEKRIVAKNWVRKIYRELGNTANMTSVDIISAIGPIDQWISDNQASFNTVLPEPFKTTATEAEKTLLFCFVAMKRANLI